MSRKLGIIAIAFTGLLTLTACSSDGGNSDSREEESEANMPIPPEDESTGGDEPTDPDLEEDVFYDITISIGAGGSVTASGVDCDSDCTKSFVENSVLNLNAVADEGYQFDGWQFDCSSAGKSTCELMMDSDKNIKALFSLSPVVPLPPPAPTGLDTTEITSSSIALQWSGVAVAESYIVERDGEEVAVVQNPSFIDDALKPDRSYNYQVFSVDAGGLRSVGSTIMMVTTLSAADNCKLEDGGLTHHFKADVLQDGNLVVDEQSSVTGVASNVAISAAGVFSQALMFPPAGTESRVELGSFSPPASGGLSISLWLKPSSLDSAEARFVSKALGSQGNDHDLMVSAIDYSGLRFRLRIGTSTTTLVSPSNLLQTDQWAHVVVTYDEVQMKIYHDGNLVASTTQAGSVAYRSDAIMAFGNQPVGFGDRQYSGLLDDVRFYQGALTEQQVTTLFSSASGDCGSVDVPVVITTPQNLVAESNSGAVTLSWQAPAEISDGLSHYQVFRDGELLADNVLAETYTDGSVETGVTYRYSVRAVNLENVISDFSNEVTYLHEGEADVTPPEVPTGLQGSEVTSQSLVLSWNPSSDIGGSIASYRIYRNGAFYLSLDAANTSFTDTGLSPDTEYLYSVAALDTSQNESAQSASIFITTKPEDTPNDTVIQFSPAAIVATKGGTGGVAKGDLDKDGRVEFVAGKLSIFDWNGSDWLEYPVTSDVGKLNRFAGDNEVLDVNNDGWLDLIITDSGNFDAVGELLWYENPQGDLSGTWIEHSVHTWAGSGTGGSITHCEETVGDIDGDGFEDIVVRDIAHGTWVFINDKNADFHTPVFLQHNPREGLELADLDADGDLDIVLNGIWFETPADAVNGSYTMHNIPGMAAWYPAGSSNAELRDYATKVRTADFNEDGRLDIVVSNSEELNGNSPSKPHGVRVFLQPANLLADNWVEVVLDPDHYSWHNLKVEDFDLDGHADIIAAISTVGIDSAPGEIKLWQGKGDGSFSSPLILGSEYGYQGETGDFDGDSLPDYFLPEAFDSGAIRAYRNLTY